MSYVLVLVLVFVLVLVLVVAVDDDDDGGVVFVVVVAVAVVGVVVVVVVVVVVPGHILYFRPKTSKKNTVFSTMFMPLEEKPLVFTTFLKRQGRKSSKNIAIYIVF